MIDYSLIRRYISAVHDLAAQADVVGRVQEELARLQVAALDDERLMMVLRHPEISAEEKRSLLLRLSGDDPTQITTGLISLLLEKERVDVLLGAGDVFTQLADAARGVVRAQVEVAWVPDDEQKQRLEEALSRLVGAPVVADFELAPDVIGGARVRVAGQLIDGSLQGRLEALVDHVGAAPMSVAGD